MGLYWVPIQLYLGKCSHISDNILKRGRYIVTTERNTDKKGSYGGQICQIGEKYVYF